MIGKVQSKWGRCQGRCVERQETVRKGVEKGHGRRKEGKGKMQRRVGEDVEKGQGKGQRRSRECAEKGREGAEMG